MTEKEFQKAVCDLARVNGWSFVHFRPGQTSRGRWLTSMDCSHAGFPDLILVHAQGKRNFIAAELKVGRNKLSLDQAKWISVLGIAGIETHVWYPEHWDLIVERLSTPWKRSSSSATS